MMTIELDDMSGLITVSDGISSQTIEVWESDSAVHKALMEVVADLKRKRKEYVEDAAYWRAA